MTDTTTPEAKVCGLCAGTGKIREGHRKCPDCDGSGRVAASDDPSDETVKAARSYLRVRLEDNGPVRRLSTALLAEVVAERRQSADDASQLEAIVSSVEARVAKQAATGEALRVAKAAVAYIAGEIDELPAELTPHATLLAQGRADLASVEDLHRRLDAVVALTGGMSTRLSVAAPSRVAKQAAPAGVLDELGVFERFAKAQPGRWQDFEFEHVEPALAAELNAAGRAGKPTTAVVIARRGLEQGAI